MDDEIVVLEAGRRKRHYWRDLWRYRELFLILAWRDVAVRYKQTLIGVAWAVIRPLTTMVVFTVVFGKLAGLPTDGNAPYALMVLAGMLPWFLFVSAFGGAAESLVTNGNLIGKAYFSRLVIPASAMLVALIDFAVSLLILAGLMIWYRYVPGWQIALLPVFVVLGLLASLGPGLWIAGLNVKYRDFRYVIPFVLQIGVYISPVGFSTKVVPEQWRWLYSVNPMVGVIDGFRWAILGGDSLLYWPGLIASAGVMVFFLWLGISRFRRMETAFADLM